MNSKPLLRTIFIHHLERGAYQPRKNFSEKQLHELAQSITHMGLLQPIVVRPHKEKPECFEIVAGERRWRAAQLAGLEKVPCLINAFTDEAAAEAATIENVNRVNLNPIEEAQAYERLIEHFGYLHEEVAATVGKSRSRITNMLRLLRLDPRVQALLMNGQLTEGHGKALVSAPQKDQWSIAEKAAKNQWSVRKVEKFVQSILNSGNLPKRLKDPNMDFLTHALAEHLCCPVNIKYDHRSGKGQLHIHFQNLDILAGVFEKMDFYPED